MKHIGGQVQLRRYGRDVGLHVLRRTGFVGSLAVPRYIRPLAGGRDALIEIRTQLVDGDALHQPPVSDFVEYVRSRSEVFANGVDLGDKHVDKRQIVIVVRNKVPCLNVSRLPVAIQSAVALLDT